MQRRHFLSTGSAALASLVFSSRTHSDDRPPVTQPRATDGDLVHEPDWDERLTIAVGPANADLVGRDEKVIQAAVDYVARWGGGTVRILPGTYRLRNAVFLPSTIRILGSGPESVVTKIASSSAKLVADSDWYDQEITVADGHDFRVGDGVVLQAKNPHNGGQEVIKRTLVARAGNRFKLDRGLRKNLWLSGAPTCASLFPLFTSEFTSHVVIENLTLDGNKENNENFNGNYGGCIFLQDCHSYTLRNIEARNYNGDGISFQICHDVVVEDCHCHGNTNLGLHPGSGSQRPLIRRNRLENNDLGLFWCWGVRYGLAEDNRIHANRRFGVSIGHNDTDNVMLNNEISDSGKVGILFRNDARGQDFWPNRNRVEQNRIVNSGDENGIAIDIQGKTSDLTIAKNTIVETRKPANRIGIRIDAEAGSIHLDANRFEGIRQEIVDRRATS